MIVQRSKASPAILYCLILALLLGLGATAWNPNILNEPNQNERSTSTEIQEQEDIAPSSIRNTQGVTYVPYKSPQHYARENTYYLSLNQGDSLKYRLNFVPQLFDGVSYRIYVYVYIYRGQNLIHSVQAITTESNQPFERTVEISEDGEYKIQISLNLDLRPVYYQLSYSVSEGPYKQYSVRKTYIFQQFGRFTGYSFVAEKAGNYKIEFGSQISIGSLVGVTTLGSSQQFIDPLPNPIALQEGQILDFHGFISPTYDTGYMPNFNVFISIQSSFLNEGEDPGYDLTFCVQDNTYTGYFNHQTKSCDVRPCSMNALTNEDCSCKGGGAIYSVQLKQCCLDNSVAGSTACECKPGFVFNEAQTQCIESCNVNALTNEDCSCKGGGAIYSVQLKQCCPDNSVAGSTACECKPGFVFNEAQTQCIEPCNVNAWTNENCLCKEGTLYRDIDSCCPDNSVAGSSECQCKTGYLWTADQTACLSCPMNKWTTGNVSSDGESCECSKDKYLWNPQIWSCQKQNKSSKSEKPKKQQSSLRSEDTISSSAFSESSSIKP